MTTSQSLHVFNHYVTPEPAWPPPHIAPLDYVGRLLHNILQKGKARYKYTGSSGGRAALGSYGPGSSWSLEAPLLVISLLQIGFRLRWTGEARSAPMTGVSKTGGVTTSQSFTCPIDTSPQSLPGHRHTYPVGLCRAGLSAQSPSLQQQ
jgi:hypothetical protein